jgi:hypothetical protein
VKTNPKVHLEAKKTVNLQGNTEQKDKIGAITIPMFKLHYRVIAIKQYGTATKTDMKTSGTKTQI